MSICSKHQKHQADCKLCNSSPRDLFPDWDEKVAEAESEGLYCCVCGYGYYLTTDHCPVCGEQKISSGMRYSPKSNIVEAWLYKDNPVLPKANSYMFVTKDKEHGGVYVKKVDSDFVPENAMVIVVDSRRVLIYASSKHFHEEYQQIK